MDPAFGYRGQRLFLKQGSADEGNEQKSELREKVVNQFAAEMDHFSECVLYNKTPHTPGEMGVADMRIVTAIHDAIHNGKPVRLKA